MADMSVGVASMTCAIEMEHADGREDIRLQQTGVHAHAALSRMLGGVPANDTAAIATAVEGYGFVVPLIGVCCAIRGKTDLCPLIVGPERSIAATDGAVAIGDFVRRGVDLELDLPAVATRFHHSNLQNTSGGRVSACRPFLCQYR